RRRKAGMGIPCRQVYDKDRCGLAEHSSLNIGSFKQELVRPTMECLTKTKRIVATFTLFLPLFCISSNCDADGFDSVRCGSDVREALLGRKMSNQKVSLREAQHKDLGLKDLGSTEISDRLFLISWK